MTHNKRVIVVISSVMRSPKGGLATCTRDALTYIVIKKNGRQKKAALSYGWGRFSRSGRLDYGIWTTANPNHRYVLRWELLVWLKTG